MVELNMRSARRLLGLLQRHEGEGPDLLLEYTLIVGIIVVVVVVVFVTMGDSLSDLVSLIGGRVDEATIQP
jgi:Flp pilus assembly pilin Flp